MSTFLDLGCGSKPKEGYLGMDILPYADISHDIEETPWPLESDSCEAINASHVLEHIKPWKIFDVMNEAWRVMKVGGEMVVKVPFGIAYLTDPSHCIQWSIPAFWHFDSNEQFHKTYKPNPWNITNTDVDHSICQISVTLKKVDK